MGTSTTLYPRRMALVLRLEALVSEGSKVWPDRKFLSELEHLLKSLSQIEKSCNAQLLVVSSKYNCTDQL